MAPVSGVKTVYGYGCWSWSNQSTGRLAGSNNFQGGVPKNIFTSLRKGEKNYIKIMKLNCNLSDKPVFKVS